MDALADHLHKLPIFLAVVRAGSIRAAAKKMDRSQSAMSRAIAVLEDAVGSRLFVRESEGIRLTEVGESLFQYADSLDSGLKKFRREIDDTQQARQTVVLGAYESIAVYFFPGFLRHATETRENIEISLFTGRSSELVDALLRSQVDIIVSVNPPERRNLFSSQLYRDEFRVYRHRELVPGDETPLLIFPGAEDEAGRSIAERVGDSIHAHRRRFVCQSFELASALSVAGLGLAVLPSRVAERFVARGELIEYTDKWRFGSHGIWVSNLRHRDGDPTISWVRSTLEQFESSSLL